MSVLAAGGAVPGFLPELVALVAGAAVVGYLSSRVRVVPIVGFLVAGVVIGPEQLGLVGEREVVDAAAEVGVILLLFTIGIEFSLDRLARVRRLIVVGGGVQVVLATAVTTALAMAGGVDADAALFTGLLVSMSSTAIVLKLLASQGRSSSEQGQGATAILVFQDLAIVAMVLAVPLLGGDDGSPADLAWALGKAAALIIAVLVGARRAMPPLLDAVARTCAPEVFLLTLVAVCFGTALLSAAVGVSVSLGAFLAGLVVSESRHSTHAFGEILPLQILFSATFFVSVGMLLDLAFLVEEPLLVVGAAAGVVAIKATTAALGARLAGLGLPSAAGIGLLLAQVGEFSFVLDELGRDEGLTPLGLGEDGSQALVATTVILMIATPLLAGVGERLEGRLGGRADRRRALPSIAPQPGGRAGGVVVLGYGAAARDLVGELRQLGAPFTVVTLNPDGAIQAAGDGVDVVVGDYGKRAVLDDAGAASARLVVVADDDAERTERVVGLVRQLNPTAAIVARPLGPVDVAELADAGADHVVTPDRASAIGLGIAVRSVLAGDDGRRPLSAVVRFVPDPSAPCPHVGVVVPVQPSAYGCEDCLRIGTTWVHLRICLSCGHVGCCDSSPQRHARAHAGADDHPIVASLEPDEAWAYCFLDDTTLLPRRS